MSAYRAHFTMCIYRVCSTVSVYRVFLSHVRIPCFLNHVRIPCIHMIWPRFSSQALLAFFQGGSETCSIQEKTMRRRQVLLSEMNKRYEYENALWSYVRSRLEVGVVGKHGGNSTMVVRQLRGLFRNFERFFRKIERFFRKFSSGSFAIQNGCPLL